MENDNHYSGINNISKQELLTKRRQKEFEEILLRDFFLEQQMENVQSWEKEIMRWASNQSCGPTEKQRAEFEQKLNLEIKRIWDQKQQVMIKEHETENSMDFN